MQNSRCQMSSACISLYFSVFVHVLIYFNISFRHLTVVQSNVTACGFYISLHLCPMKCVSVVYFDAHWNVICHNLPKRITSYFDLQLFPIRYEKELFFDAHWDVIFQNVLLHISICNCAQWSV